MDSINTNYKPAEKTLLLSVTNIVLIGFMGSGKSSIGKRLVKDTDRYFLDTDALIESAEGESIDDIFKNNGEVYFRNKEEETVNWLKENVSKAIISTGGGMLVYCEALKEVGKIIYLKVPFDVILSRMNKDELSKRPLFQNIDKAKEMYEKRDLIYTEKADLIIDANASLEEVVLRLSSEIS